MYESHYTHHFFRLWGVKEGKKGIDPTSLLLGNAQNSFDAKFGDIAAVVKNRFFLIEFKVERNGIAQEVGPGGKLHRQLLGKHLQQDRRCRLLSSRCHFAAFSESRPAPIRNQPPIMQLAFERYIDAAELPFKPSAQPPSAQRKGRSILNGESRDDIGAMATFANRRTDFHNFHYLLANEKRTISEKYSGCYESGLGLPGPAFIEYIGCMYQHLKTMTNEEGEAVLCAFDPRKNEFIGFPGTIQELVKSLFRVFRIMLEQLHQEQLFDDPTQPNPAHWGLRADDEAFKAFGFTDPAARALKPAVDAQNPPDYGQEDSDDPGTSAPRKGMS